MNEPEEHPTSLLLAYVRGELEDDDARAIQDHLDGCRRCADEEGGARMLILDPGSELNDLERARLHHAVIAATTESRAIHGNPFARRLAPYLGTAAVLALLAVGILVVDPAGDDAAGPESGVEAEMDAGPPALDEDGARRLNVESQDEAATEELGEDASGAFVTGQSAGPTPHFEPAAGRMAAADLDRLGRSSEPFSAFARAYEADAAPVVQPTVLEQLTNRFPAREKEVVRACARQVLRTRTAIPVYGGYGSLDGEEVLLLGFAWTPGTSGALDRFMVWAWPRGSCESPLVYRFGWIDR